MKEYEFTALIEVALIIKAETEERARRELGVYSADGWIKRGEVIGITDIDLVSETGEIGQ